MNLYYHRRQILSDALCPHLFAGIQSLFAQFETGGSLLTSDKNEITSIGDLGEMVQVMSAALVRKDGEQRHVALVFQPINSEYPSVSILTDRSSARHTIEIMDDDIAASIEHLKDLIDEVLQQLATD